MTSAVTPQTYVLIYSEKPLRFALTAVASSKSKSGTIGKLLAYLYITFIRVKQTNWFLSLKILKQHFSRLLDHEMSAKHCIFKLQRIKTKIFVWIHVFFQTDCTVSLLKHCILRFVFSFCFFSVTQNQNWFMVSLHCFTANSNTAFQVEDLIYTQRLWVLSCKVCIQ